jgi:hypothetical protein
VTGSGLKLEDPEDKDRDSDISDAISARWLVNRTDLAGLAAATMGASRASAGGPIDEEQVRVAGTSGNDPETGSDGTRTVTSLAESSLGT